MSDMHLMTVAEVAERLRCSSAFVYALLVEGSLKYYALGKGQGGKRISEEQLRQYLDDRERGGAGPQVVRTKVVKQCGVTMKPLKNLTLD